MRAHRTLTIGVTAIALMALSACGTPAPVPTVTVTVTAPPADPSTSTPTTPKPSTPASPVPDPAPDDGSSTVADVAPADVQTFGAPLRVALVGDSNTTGLQSNLETGIKNGVAWISQVQDSTIEFAGGWARDGSQTERMAQMVAPVDDADVLVIMSGTNDVAHNKTVAESTPFFDSIAETVGAQQVVLFAIPAFNALPDEAMQWNRDLAVLAAERGWGFHDPWTAERGPDGKWVEQYRKEGLHTNPEGYRVMGEDAKAYLLGVFGG